MRPAWHGEAGGRRRRGGGRADDAGGDRPAGDLSPHARGRRPGLRDGGLLACAGPAPGRRDPLRAGAVHQPDPGPPRLPRRHGGLLPLQAPAVRDGAQGGGRQRRRPLRAPPRRGLRVPDLLGRGRGGDFSARDVSFDASGAEFRVAISPLGQKTESESSFRPAGAEVEVRTALPGHFNVANALGAFAAALAMGVEPGDAAAGLARAERVPGRLRADRRGPGLRGPGRLRPHARLAGERPARGAAVHRGPGDLGLRRRRRPRSRQAAEDGAGRRRGSPTWRSSPPTTRAPRTPRRSSPKSSPGSRTAPASRSSPTAAPRSRSPSGGHGPATRWSSPARATSRVRSSRTAASSPSTTARSPARSSTLAAAAMSRRGRMNLDARQIAVAMGAEIVAEGGPGSPVRATIDSGETGAGDLFFGLRGERVDGGEFAAAAIEAGAWGVVVGPGFRRRLSIMGRQVTTGMRAAAGSSPLRIRWRRCRRWRGPGGGRSASPSSGITGSVGKTSVKDIARALLPGRVHANRENLNTEIGLPLTVLEAPAGHRLLVLEMAMRGAGQIAELAAIAEPEVAVITNVGPSTSSCSARSRRSPRRRPSSSTTCPPAGPRSSRSRRASSSPTSRRPRRCSASARAATSRRSSAGSSTASPRRWSRRPPGASSSTSPSPRRTTSPTRWPRSPPGSRSARRSTDWPTALRT